MNKGPGKIENYLIIGVLGVLLLAPLKIFADVGSSKTILFLGDSLTAGYGIQIDQAYPALIQEKIEEAGLNWKVVPGGLSGETTAGGLRRIDWVMRQPIDILVIALGGNDGLRGLDLKDSKQNLQGIIDKARAKYPEIGIVIAGMKMPPNMGATYTESFEKLYSELAEENDAALIPFLLEGVGGVKALNQGDGIHPNPEGQVVVAETVWKVIEPLLSGSEIQ